jgi:hypothetical protein
MLLIYGDEKLDSAPGSPGWQELMAAYERFTLDVEKSGALQAGAALHPVASATSVRVRDGQTLHTDGPFAETKEQLGGMYILDCQDLDQALAWAAKIPTAKTGTIEVRPIMEF